MPQSELIFNYFRYPIIPVKFYNKDKKTPYIDALLDSGGDFIVVPLPIAKYLGLKLKKAGSVDTAGGATTLYKSKLSMDIGKGEYVDSYKHLQIHISERDDIPVLIGRSPVFEDYEIIFNKKINQLKLKNNIR